MIYVRQPHASQLCSQASLATILGMALEQVCQRAGTGRLGQWSMWSAFPKHLMPPTDEDGTVRTHRPGVPAVCLTIPSDPAKRAFDVGHTIVWDGTQFWDPADGYTGPVPDPALGYEIVWTLELRTQHAPQGDHMGLSPLFWLTWAQLVEQSGTALGAYLKVEWFDGIPYVWEPGAPGRYVGVAGVPTLASMILG